MQYDTGWGDLMNFGDYTSGGGSYPGYSYSPGITGGGGGDWFSNALNSVWSGVSSPNTWKSLIPLGMTAMSAFGQPKQATPQWSTPPMSAQMSGVAQEYLNMANQPLFSNAQVEDQLRQLQGIQAQRGLGTVGSGSWNKMLAELMQNNVSAQQQYKSNMLGNAAGVYGRYAPQAYVQQPQNPWYANAAQTYTNLANSANLSKALNPTQGYSWFPWSNMGI